MKRPWEDEKAANRSDESTTVASGAAGAGGGRSVQVVRSYESVKRTERTRICAEDVKSNYWKRGLPRRSAGHGWTHRDRGAGLSAEAASLTAEVSVACGASPRIIYPRDDNIVVESVGM